MGSLDNLRRGNPGNRGGGRHRDEFIQVLRENNIKAAEEIERRLDDPDTLRTMTVEQLCAVFDRGAKYTHGLKIQVSLSEMEATTFWLNWFFEQFCELAPQTLNVVAERAKVALEDGRNALELSQMPPGWIVQANSALS